MDKVIDLTTTVRQTVESYVSGSHGGTLHFAENVSEARYIVYWIPNDPKEDASVVVVAHVEDNKAVIDIDSTDRYLYRLLARAGVPRDKIIRAYLGETVPLSQIPVD
jgi:hypothetical protein